MGGILKKFLCEISGDAFEMMKKSDEISKRIIEEMTKRVRGRVSEKNQQLNS